MYISLSKKSTCFDVCSRGDEKKGTCKLTRGSAIRNLNVDGGTFGSEIDSFARGSWRIESQSRAKKGNGLRPRG